MHLSAVFSLALVVSPLAVSARGTLGFAIGARKEGGQCKTRVDYEADFDALAQASGSKIVRTYSVIDKNVAQFDPCQVAAEILPAAANKEFQVILGLWAESYESEKAALLPVLTSKYGNTVYALTVGSESLYRGVSACDVFSAIDDARTTFGSIVKRVGTADSWNKFQDGTADPILTGDCPGPKPRPGVTFLLVNAFGYWQGQKINNATATYLDDLQQAMGHIQKLAGLNTVEIWNGETGWPGDNGSNYGEAEAGTQNEATFFQHGVCAALAWGINVFYFEATDETWKPKSVGDSKASADEQHWGALDASRTPKFKLTC
ncbi:MAG: hypothetical protein Q9212_001663 [Teloschistes hypoglaucus]